jgi:glutamine amidotransferase/cyclase
MPTVQLLDYISGNIRSLVNAIEKLGYDVEWIRDPKDVERAEVMCHCNLVSRMRSVDC